METNEQTYSDSTEGPPKGKSPAQWHAYWDTEIKAFMKRAKKFRKNGNKIIDRFLDEATTKVEGANTYRVNLFNKNVRTLQAMLYGNKPKIDVKREHDDPDDDVARVAAVMIKRILDRDVTAPGNALSSILEQCLQDRLLPGLGTARLRYEFQSKGEGENEQLSYENVVEEYVHWQDFAWGWARTWTEVPWVGFRSWLSEEEVEKRFGSKIAQNLEYEKQKISQKDTDSSDNEGDNEETVEKAEVWEIWCKERSGVYWYSPGAKLILDHKSDPLGLEGFFPCPTPMIANLTTREVMPKAEFLLSQDLYNQVDVLNTRIAMITKAVKVVGVYDKSSEGVKQMLTDGFENQLIPVDSWAAFAEKGGLAGQIDWMPIEEIAGVLTHLRGELAANMEMLYEVTGLSDIMRGGNTNPYVSDGTNKLKAKFGSIEVQTLQEQFAKFAAELEQIKAEIASKHFNPATIYMNSSAQFLPKADEQYVMPAIQLITSSQIKWRINIKPESLAMADYAQLKSERTEYLTSVATFLQSAASLVQSVPGSLPVLLEMLKWGMAGFKGADYLEGTLDQAINMAQQSQGQQQDDGAAKAEQAKQATLQMQHQNEMEKIAAKKAADQEIAQVKFQGEIARVREELQSTIKEIQAKSNADLTKIIEDMQADLQIIAAKMQAEIQGEQAQAANAAAEAQVEHENTLTEMQVEHQNAKVEARQGNGRAD